MPLKKILVRPGVARENTRYLSENVGPTGVNGSYAAGWYDCDKIRFRSGSAEKLGGWAPFSTEYYLGICRSLNNWVTLGGNKLIGVGTNLKFYVNQGGSYYDVTPLRSYTEAPVSLSNPFDTTSGSAVINVNDTAHGLVTGDVATFSGAVAVVAPAAGIPATDAESGFLMTAGTVTDASGELPTALSIALAPDIQATLRISIPARKIRVLLLCRGFMDDVKKCMGIGAVRFGYFAQGG